ncbi:transcriptional regulator, RpiR family [Methylobacterium sp. 174MFSha1.1]|uniref:MurR/RpiR family transcriptional regulator n=1 Tax=Methylobacterium sp. 174MFSha1.1 TaxID=1502749 RepID=UPI0008EA37DA|nr:MurR/RpiR family transcriptional regulator [Methylobacterium sp. 174MFSha1.1]SFU47765.1 transcriptional regulator, RpiR family [Methylobacterium sp. 174MFSha1.1]
MSDGMDPRSVGPRIRMMRPNLTPLEAKVVDSVFERRDFSAETALKDVAEAAGVSEAMVVKIAKKLGFSGYRDFRQNVADYVRLSVAEMDDDLSPDDSGAEIVGKVFRASIQALEETLAIADVAAFERAADFIAQGRQRDFYGIGGSAQIARDVAHKFLRIGIRASVYDDAHMMAMSASLLGTRDVAVGFSHSGATLVTLEALQIARRRGARTIAITNYPHSALAEVADVVLCSTARGSPLLGENAAARIAQLSLLDAIYVLVARRDIRSAEANLALTRDAVREKRRG